jgi:hypothetical protein
MRRQKIQDQMVAGITRIQSPFLLLILHIPNPISIFRRLGHLSKNPSKSEAPISFS